MWDGRHVIYVNGFHENYVESLRTASSSANRWMKDPVVVMDGGSAYWCAIYINDTGQFVAIKQEGRPKRTVAFHGYG
jgi:hypothetical protein